MDWLDRAGWGNADWLDRGMLVVGIALLRDMAAVALVIKHA